MKEKLSWEDAQTFLAVAEHQSFSGAARALGVGQPTVSRRIKALESTLEEQLFDRGKYGAVATTAATRLLPAAEQMARWASEFDRAVVGFETRVEGVVRLAAPPGVAVEQLAPFAARMREREPRIKLEVLSSVEHIDLTRGMADIAIRTQSPGEPELVALHSARSSPGVYASPEYAARFPGPTSWAQIDWITWSESHRHVVPRPMLERLIPEFRPVFTSDDYLVQKAAAKAGIGAMILGQPMAHEADQLVQIDVGVSLPAHEFHIVVAKSMQQVPRVKLVVEQMVAMMREDDAISIRNN